MKHLSNMVLLVLIVCQALLLALGVQSPYLKGAYLLMEGHRDNK